MRMHKNIYSLQTAGKITAGINSIENIKDILSDCNAKKVLIITDQGVWNAGLVERILIILKTCQIDAEIINSTPPEPEIGHVRDIFNEVKDKEFQLVIGVGGGSSMDVAKIISVLMTNRCDIQKILGTDKIKNRGIHTLLIPTTAGTGSEVTPNAIVLVPEEELKVGIVSNKLIPDYVILDPVLTVNLPPHITANTGIDALTHAMECYISLKGNPFSDMLALEAIRLIAGSIRKAFHNGNNMEARHDMLLGSMYGGMCIATSGTAAVHALAYPLGSKYRIPHGLSNAMLLPYVMEFNMEAVEGKFKDMAAAMGLYVNNLSSSEASKKLVESLYSLIKDLNIQSALKNKNITENDLDMMVEGASKVTRLLDNNPKKLTKSDMRSIYRKLL